MKKKLLGLINLLLVITLFLPGFSSSVKAYQVDSEFETEMPASGNVTKLVKNLSRDDGTNMVGDILEYTVVLSNEQELSTWRNVKFLDTLPEELDFEDSSGMTINDVPTLFDVEGVRTISLALGDLHGEDWTRENVFVPKDIVTLKFKAKINETAYGKTIINTAYGYGWQGVTDPKKHDASGQDQGIQVLGKQTGLVTVRYQDTTGNPLAEEQQLSGEIGESYETKALELDGYTLAQIEGTEKGTYQEKPQTVTYIYSPNPISSGTVTAHYQDVNGLEIAESVALNGAIGDSYETNTKHIEGYELKEIKGNAKGTFTPEAQTVIYVYQKNQEKNTGSVNVKYEDTSGKALADPTQLTGGLGKEYQTEAKKIEGYTLKEIKGNAKGTFGSVVQTVVYVYQKNQEKNTGSVNVKYEDTSGKALADPTQLTGGVGKEYQTEAKKIEGYTLKEIKGKAKGTFDSVVQTVVYVYQKDATGRVSTTNSQVGSESHSYVQNGFLSSNKKLLPQTGSRTSFKLVICGVLILLAILLLILKRKYITKYKK